MAPLTIRLLGDGPAEVVTVTVLVVVAVLTTEHEPVGGADVVVTVAGQRHEQALDTRLAPQEVDTYEGNAPTSVTAVVVKVAQKGDASAARRDS